MPFYFNIEIANCINVSTGAIIYTHTYIRSISIKRRVSYNVSIVYVNGKDLSAISGLSDRNVDFAKLLSTERGAIGKQTLETV